MLRILLLQIEVAHAIEAALSRRLFLTLYLLFNLAGIGNRD